MIWWSVGAICELIRHLRRLGSHSGKAMGKRTPCPVDAQWGKEMTASSQMIRAMSTPLPETRGHMWAPE